MSWQFILEIFIGAFSTLLAIGVESWLRTYPNRIWKLAAPAVWLLCLAVGSAIATKTIGEHPIIVTLTYVAIVLGGCRIAFLLSHSRRTAWILTTVLCSVALLTLFELRQPFVTYLDSFTVHVGERRISLLRVLEAASWLLISFWMARTTLHWLAIHIRKSPQFDGSVQEWLIKLSELTLYFLVLAFALNHLGIDITTLAVFGGALGVGLGFGLQKIISNYVSGLILLFEKTVKVGDVIELEGGPSGHVYRLDPRGTFIWCSDGKEVIIPNEEFITKKVTNLTYSDKRGQVAISVGISYGSDVEKACQLLLEAATECPLCLTDPAPNCYLKEFGAYSIQMLLQFWIDDVSHGINQPQSDVMRAILRKFKEHGIEIPVYYQPY